MTRHSSVMPQGVEHTRDQILRAQRAINEAGLGPVTVDGVYGPRTAAAYAELLRRSDVGGGGLPMPAPPAPKPWWTSRAVIGALAVIASSLAALAGVSLDSGALTDTLTALVTAIGGALALWGSVRRSAPIDGSLVAPGLRLEYGRLQREPLPSKRSSDAPYWSDRRGPLDPGQ